MSTTDAEVVRTDNWSGRLIGIAAREHRKTILPQIDGLRGVAICAVIFQHAFSHGISQTLVASGVVRFPYLLDDGWMGVSLFFILSGFALSLPYTGAETKFYDPAEAIAFYRRRARRLLPLFAIGCLVGYLLKHPPLDSLLRALTTMSMFSADEFFPRVNGPFWTLMLEIWFSISLPALMIAAARFGYWRVFAVAAATALIVRLFGTQLHFPDPHINLLKDSVPARIDDFIVGMVIAKLYRDGQLRTLRWLCLPGLALVLISGLSWDLIVQGTASRWLGGLLNLITSTGFACVIISCLAQHSISARAISWPPLRVVGAMCFSLYLRVVGAMCFSLYLRVVGAMCFSLYCWHFLIVEMTYPNSLEIGRVALFLLTTAGISLLSYRFIEFPQKSWRSLLMAKEHESSNLALTS